jgi:hypothetical protein
MNGKAGKCGFIHPSELGLDFPINTSEELCQIAKAINAGHNRTAQAVKEQHERKVYQQLHEKYGKK